jgi:hypothetical protein
MRPNRLFKQERITIIISSFIFLFLLTAMTLKYQIPTNFSGKWEFDKTKSSFGQVNSNYDGTVIRQITLNSSTITYGDILIQPGSDDWKTAKN